MPFAELADLRLRYEFDGPQRAPVVLLSNSLGATLDMWAPQMPALLTQFRVLRYDTRGHGMSDVPPEPYSLAQLGEDVIALLDRLGLAQVHFCGLSLGGLTGMWLATHHPQRIERLVLCNTAAKIGNAETWAARIEGVRSQGMAAVAGQVIERWFTSRFRAVRPEKAAALRAAMETTSAAGYAGCCAAIRDADLREEIAAIRAPTMVIAGSHDPSTPAADGRFVAERISGARYVELDSAHLSNWEQPGAFTGALIEFLTDEQPTEAARFEIGLAARRATLGDAHVDRSLSTSDEFNRDFQRLITRYAWGETWTRATLPAHTRSLLTIAMLVALNRGDELRLHLRAARNNGVTREEIKEVLLQATIYCGVPAANSAFHMARDIFAEMDSTNR